MNKIIKFRHLSAIILSAAVAINAHSLLFAGVKVYPRIITPGTPQSNDNVFFDFDDFDEPKPELKIFDLNGRTVRSIQALNPVAISTGWRLVWDGKDDSGRLVFPGVYIYQWNEGNSKTTGTIVVAR